MNAGAVRLAVKLLAPWRRLTSPVFLDFDQVPETRKLLFVGNHTLYGVLDVPLLFAELFEKRGILLRSLGHHAHFKVPLWGDFLARFGAVDGTRENCDALMHEGEPVLVFPGGAREVFKRKGEKYQLLWKERLGFARMAVRHRYRVVPFASIGVEDALEIVADADDLLASPLGALLRKVGAEALVPIAKPMRPERIYFAFGAPIDAGRFAGDESDASCRALRDEVRAAVEARIATLLRHRDADPERSLSARLGRRS